MQYGRRMTEPLDRWFIQEIVPHEAALMRYLRRAWSHADEIHDLRQEVYVRVYEAAKKARPHSAKSFLFATARNLLADRMRRQRVVSIESVGDWDALNVPLDEISPERSLGGRQDLKRLTDAFDILPERCREVLWLRRVEDLPQRDVAARLGIGEKTVEKQLAKGVRIIADLLFGDGETKRDTRAQREHEHGKQHRD